LNRPPPYRDYGGGPCRVLPEPGISGTTLFGLGVYAVEMIVQLATFIALYFALGILLGYLRHRTGSTWLTVILHGAHNAISIAQVALLFGFA
jgi:hypothetical protein